MSLKFYPYNFLADSFLQKRNQRIEKLCGKNGIEKINFILLQQLQVGTKNGEADSFTKSLFLMNTT